MLRRYRKTNAQQMYKDWETASISGGKRSQSRRFQRKTIDLDDACNPMSSEIGDYLRTGLIRNNGTGQFVHLIDQRRDAAEELVAWRALVELDICRRETLIDDFHDLRNHVVDLAILIKWLVRPEGARYISTYVGVDILQYGVKPDKPLGQVLLQRVGDNGACREG